MAVQTHSRFVGIQFNDDEESLAVTGPAAASVTALERGRGRGEGWWLDSLEGPRGEAEGEGGGEELRLMNDMQSRST